MKIVTVTYRQYLQWLVYETSWRYKRLFANKATPIEWRTFTNTCGVIGIIGDN